MRQRLPRFLSPLGLRTKLVLSYLVVALGAIIILSIAVTAAVQNYFANAQAKQFQASARLQAQQIGQFYMLQGSDWEKVHRLPPEIPNTIELLIDTDGSRLSPSKLSPVLQQFLLNNKDILEQDLDKALKGEERVGRLPVKMPDGPNASVLYVFEPLYANGQAKGPLIGVLLLITPEQYPQGSPPYDFLKNVDQAILLTGIAVAFAAIIFSLVSVRSLTRPLRSLTIVAEQMKNGNYAQRVKLPQSGDELEQLGSTFNAMADTIEADVTELRRQEQLRRDLIANIAHDLMTPLTAIQGFSEALADDVIVDPTRRQETAQLIGREVFRLRRLVSDIQQMSALEAGHVQLDLASLDIYAQVNETLKVIEADSFEDGITLHNEIAPDTPPVLADGDRITQVLFNLLDNARRHTPPGGHISIGARIESSWLAIRVCDTGSGINPADLPFIFERFYRADRSRTGATGGSGLGLSIVKAIITAHRGTVRAESRLGEGTCITFTLPLDSLYKC
jgi:two-component system sensor histidine kinase BaeS